MIYFPKNSMLIFSVMWVMWMGGGGGGGEKEVEERREEEGGGGEGELSTLSIPSSSSLAYVVLFGRARPRGYF